MEEKKMNSTTPQNTNISAPNPNLDTNYNNSPLTASIDPAQELANQLAIQTANEEKDPSWTAAETDQALEASTADPAQETVNQIATESAAEEKSLSSLLPMDAYSFRG